jgi:hypothetical protein
MSENIIRSEMIGGYQMTPKAAPTGGGRINPMRSYGESETRGSLFSPMGKLNSEMGINSEDTLNPTGMQPQGYHSVFNADQFIERHGLDASKWAAPNGHEVGVNSFGEIEARVNANGYYAFDPETVSAARAVIEQRGSLHEAEYFNRKLALSGYNADFDGNALSGPVEEPERRIPRFIFEPDTILYQEIDKVTVKLRLPYPQCVFIQQPALVGYDVAAMNDITDEIKAIELSATKILFSCIYKGRDFLVQVNQFRNKDDDDKVFYKTFLAQGPDKLLDRDASEWQYKDQIFAFIAPIYAFLEGLAVGVYSLKREGARDISDKTPPKAKEGITFKVLRMIPDQPSQEYIPKGGTHASPREHERRAYTRIGSNGKVQHIPATTVNKGKTPGGLVIKDYNIKDPKK